MANALTGLALYSALAEQVYRRARDKGNADQPLAVYKDGKVTVTFRGTDAGDSSFWTLVSASVGSSSPDTLDQPGLRDTYGHAPRPARRTNVIASRPCGAAIQGRHGLRWRPLDCHGASAPRNDVWAA